MAHNELLQFLKILRIRKNIRLYDMAKSLGISSSYLSSIETGKRQPPLHFESEIIKLYDLSQEEAQTLTNIVIAIKDNWTITPKNLEQKETTALFARKVDSLSSKKLKQIRNLINEIEE